MAQCYLTWSLPKGLKDIILGDLEEEFQLKCLTKGNLTAQIWYLRQAFLTSLNFLNQTQRGMLMFAVSIMLFIGVIAMACWMSGDFSMFIDIPSLIVVVPSAILFAFAATSKKAMSDGMKLMFDEQLTLQKNRIAHKQKGI
jgi:ABC-type multidrug transport system fused ATPase/permease subunit